MPEIIYSGTDGRSARVYPESYYERIVGDIPEIDNKGPNGMKMKKLKEETIKEYASFKYPSPFNNNGTPYLTDVDSITVSSVSLQYCPKHGVLPSNFAGSEMAHRLYAIPYGFLDQEEDFAPIQVEVYTSDDAQGIYSKFTSVYTGKKEVVTGANVAIPQRNIASSTLFVFANINKYLDMNLVYGFKQGDGMVFRLPFLPRDTVKGGQQRYGMHITGGTTTVYLSINGHSPKIIDPGQEVGKAFSDSTPGSKVFEPSVPPVRPFTISYESHIETGSFVCGKGNREESIYKPIMRGDASCILGKGDYC